MQKLHGKLFIISTPIVNLTDITIRAIETLKTVNIIATENLTHECVAQAPGSGLQWLDSLVAYNPIRSRAWCLSHLRRQRSRISV